MVGNDHDQLEASLLFVVASTGTCHYFLVEDSRLGSNHQNCSNAGQGCSWFVVVGTRRI
jgi:hypothetical protein